MKTVLSPTATVQISDHPWSFQACDSSSAQKVKDIYLPENTGTAEARLKRLMRLQRGASSIQEQYEIVAIFNEVSSPGAMARLILDLESGSDPYDMDHLLEQDLREEALRQMVKDKIKSLLPSFSLVWFGDDLQGDLQTALMMAAHPVYQKRFVAFIRVVPPLDDEAKKISGDIHTAAAHCASLGLPFPEELKKLAENPTSEMLPEFSTILAKYNIHLMSDFSAAKTCFDRLYGKKDDVWIVASDTDETTITKDVADQHDPSSRGDFVRGHAESIAHINKTNPWLASQHPYFFYTITARPRLLRQATYHTLQRLAARHKDLPTGMYGDLSVKTGVFADFMQGFRVSSGQSGKALRYEAYGLRKAARLQAILNLWE